MTREKAQKILATWLASGKSADGQRGYIEGWFDKDDAEAFRMAIEALSAADIQEVESATIHNEGITFSYRKKGEWIYAKEQLEIVPMWECSCCRTRISKKFNYCPNCGAKMKGGEDE